MAIVTQPFQQFIAKLELTPAEHADAVRQHPDVSKNLCEKLQGAKGTFLAGSFKRGTAIRPPHDIDIFLVLDEGTQAKLRSQPLADCLGLVHGVLAKSYPKASIRTQTHSVNITFADTKIGYDIVPAFAHSQGGYLILDRARNTWIRTDPTKHEEACSAADKLSGNKLNPLIKAAKRWKNLHGKPIGSFHLEVMAYEAFPKAPASLPEGFGALLAFLAERVVQKTPCADPAKLGARVDPELTDVQRDAIGKQLASAAAAVQQAITHDSAGRTEQAHAVWRSLLGDDYPERGR